jgi:diacylglycerol kinase family enzyme
MRATLIHNPTAGSAQPSAETLMGWLRAAGYDVRYASSKQKAYVEALEGPTDLIIVAGGDGTVTKVATRIVGRGVPLAILPLGTSNNIATTLGVQGAPEEIIRALPTAEQRRLDTAVALAPWGRSPFVESAGLGLFASMLEHAERVGNSFASAESGEDQLAQRVRGARRMLARHTSRFYQLEADRVDLSGPYVLAVAMNIKRIGATLELAPQADPADGKLDLVLLREDDRETLDAHLAQLVGPAPAPFPLVPRPVSVVRIAWDLAAGHLDDERWPRETDAESSAAEEPPVVQLSVVDPPLTVLVGTRST